MEKEIMVDIAKVCRMLFADWTEEDELDDHQRVPKKYKEKPEGYEEEEPER